MTIGRKIWLAAILFLTGCAVEVDPVPTSEPRSVSTANFQIVTESRIDARALLSDLEQLRLAILKDWGMSGAETERRSIVLTFIEDRDIYFTIAPLSHATSYYALNPMGDNIVIYDSPYFTSDEPDAANILQNITRHEVVHTLMNRYLRYAYPSWAEEGLAEYYSHFSRDASGAIMFGELEINGSQTESDYLDQVLRSYGNYPDFGDPADEEYSSRTRQYYMLSHQLAHRLLRGERTVHDIERWHAATSSGTSLSQASRDMLGLPPEEQEEPSDGDSQSIVLTIRRAEDIPDVSPESFEPILMAEPEYTAHLRRLVRLHRPLKGDDRKAVFGRLMQASSDQADYHLARAYEAFNQASYYKARQYLSRSMKRDADADGALFLQAALSMNDLLRSGPSKTRSQTAREDFEKAVGKIDDPTFLYALKGPLLYETRQFGMLLSEIEALEREILVYLDWLETNEVHATHPHLAQMLIDIFLRLEKWDYAEHLFATAVNYKGSNDLKEWLWQRYESDFDLVDKASLIPVVEETGD